MHFVEALNPLIVARASPFIGIVDEIKLFSTIGFSFRLVASLDRKRLGTKLPRKTSPTRGVFDEGQGGSRRRLRWTRLAMGFE
jgi:hypothetical protein